MEMQSSPDDTLLKRLVDAKLAGKKIDPGSRYEGYQFNSNEQAAERALEVLGEWLQEHCDPDQLVIEAAVNWYDKLVEVGHYSAERRASSWPKLSSDRWPPEIVLAVAVERLKGYA